MDAPIALTRRGLLHEALRKPTCEDGGYFVWQFGDSGIAFGALHAPVTMLLPTAAFIFVPIFIIVLGPIAIRVFSGTLL